jgi:hypothetical protein
LTAVFVGYLVVFAHAVAVAHQLSAGPEFPIHFFSLGAGEIALDSDGDALLALAGVEALALGLFIATLNGL